MLFTGQQHLQIYDLQIYIIYLKYELTYLFYYPKNCIGVSVFSFGRIVVLYTLYISFILPNIYLYISYI